MRKRNILPAAMLLCGVLFWGCADDSEHVGSPEKIPSMAETEKGYDLPIGDAERREAEADGRKMMELVSDIYRDTVGGDAPDGILPEEGLCEMTELIGETGVPVRSNKVYFNMENYEKLEAFLNASAAGDSGRVVVYEIHSDGGIGRYEYFCDGEDMYVLAANFIWNDEESPVMAYISRTRIREWRYTERGWFAYKLCVPEYPEVTEVVDGSCLIRVRPITDENRELSEKYVFGLGYRGNNLLCSDWDAEHLEALDYNGMYEYLYAMKHQREFPAENYPEGIPKEEFEKLITEYLPVTAEEIRQYAAFDEEKQNYVWRGLPYSEHISDWFETSVPEVTDVRENEDGTVTLTVDAVCDMVLCDDAVITHELTILPLEDGGVRYLGNRVLDDGIQEIPDYQYRVGERE